LDVAGRELVLSISNSLDAIDSLLRALFDISKLDAGVMSMELSNRSIGPLLDQLAREYQPQARAVGLELRVLPCRQMVRSDHALLARILRNFLSNALRYTERGRIVLGCRRRANKLCIEVWDTGCGIPADRIPEVFQEFQQIVGTARPRDKGIGLGLAIVERIARLLGHPILVRSWLGQGSCFAVEVPMAVRASEDDTATQLADPVQARTSLVGRNVLAIDDDPAGLAALAALLSAWGCQVTQIRSGADLDAWLCDQAPRPDVVVADYHLDDGTNGPHQIGRLRSWFGGTLPAFIVTSDQSRELRASLKGQGLACLNKPIAPAKLRTLITHLLNDNPASR